LLSAHIRQKVQSEEQGTSQSTVQETSNKKSNQAHTKKTFTTRVNLTGNMKHATISEHDARVKINSFHPVKIFIVFLQKIITKFHINIYLTSILQFFSF
ncbi:hypothetical protein T09_15530, partial [Trichinella sp. T9]